MILGAFRRRNLPKAKLASCDFQPFYAPHVSLCHLHATLSLRANRFGDSSQASWGVGRCLGRYTGDDWSRKATAIVRLVHALSALIIS
jgi:hypothetical protein